MSRGKIKDIIFHWMVIISLFWTVALVTSLNLPHSRSSIDAFQEYGFYRACIFFTICFMPWLSIPIAVSSICGLVFYNPYRKAKTTRDLTSLPFLCFRMVTRGDMPDFVSNNAMKNKHTCELVGLQRFVVEIVSDKPINCPKDLHVRETVVPLDYKTKKMTLFKARALNYCLEPNVNYLAGNDWIIHLDEETLLTEESVKGIIHFVASGTADIGQGPVRYLDRSDEVANWLTSLADSIRLCLDYGLFRFQFACLHRPVFGFKGSYVVIRNRVEIDVGLDLGPKGSIAEDCFFALRAWSREYRFDFITGEMVEKSPVTILDFVKQRKRWFIGQMYTVLSKEIPLRYKSGIILSLVCCLLMPVSVSSIFINLAYPFRRPVILCVVNGIVGGTFLFLYSFGAFMSTSRRNWLLSWRIIISLLCATVIIPIAALLESFATYWGLLTMNTNEFFIIKKDVTKLKQTLNLDSKRCQIYQPY